jgi:hypothetical protein
LSVVVVWLAIVVDDAAGYAAVGDVEVDDEFVDDFVELPHAAAASTASAVTTASQRFIVHLQTRVALRRACGDRTHGPASDARG